MTFLDGHVEINEFPATYSDKQIHYEMIQLDETGTKRSRVWQWFENGECTRRTLINERKVG